MSDRVISKDKIKDVLHALLSAYTVVAPLERTGGPAEFVEIGPDDEPFLSGDKMMMPAKDYFLPRYEVLLKVNTKKGEQSVQALVPSDKPRVMMGMWLPDAQALQVLDRVFLDQKFEDPYYAARRANTALVAVIPADLRWSWFSSSVDDVEGWKKNIDALMYDLGDKFYVEIVTQKGGAVWERVGSTEPAESDIRKKNELWEKFKGAGVMSFAAKALYDNLAWDDPIWSEISEKCIACGMCSYMCPTCSCFDIQDETCGACVERYRCRDTCQFKDFTLMGMGHNPRPTQLPRSRQRLLHKFSYQYSQFGVVGCTGCGRCIELCPVNIDIREVLMRTCSKERAD